MALMHTQTSNLTCSKCSVQHITMNRTITCHYASGCYSPFGDFHFLQLTSPTNMPRQLEWWQQKCFLTAYPTDNTNLSFSPGITLINGTNPYQSHVLAFPKPHLLSSVSQFFFQWLLSHHSQSAMGQLARFLSAMSSNLRTQSYFHITFLESIAKETGNFF